jgi:hypothetical protein
LLAADDPARCDRMDGLIDARQQVARQTGFPRYGATESELKGGALRTWGMLRRRLRIRSPHERDNSSHFVLISTPACTALLAAPAAAHFGARLTGRSPYIHCREF